MDGSRARADLPDPASEPPHAGADRPPAGANRPPVGADRPRAPASVPASLPAGATVQGGPLFFTACTVELGCELWASDGSPAGTALVREIVPGTGGGSIEEIAASGDRVFLIVSLPGEPKALWVADGRTRGLQRLRTAPEASRLAGDGAGRAFFLAEANGLEVWASDGTAAGTRPVTSFGPRDPFARVGDTARILFLLGGRAWFVANDGKHGHEVWSAGPRPESLRRASNLRSPQPSITDLGKAGDRVVFATDGYSGSPKLWSSRGDFRSATQLAGCPGGCPAPVGPFASLAPGRLVFYGHDREEGGLWITDGTGAGTRLLRRTGPRKSLSQVVPLDGLALVEITEEYETGQLWVTDGTPQGTARLLDIAPGLLGSSPRSLTAWNGRLWFRARDAVHGMELWTSDGTAQGTRLVQDISPGPAWSSPGAFFWTAPVDFTPTEAGLYFTANDGRHGRELWVLPEP